MVLFLCVLAYSLFIDACTANFVEEPLYRDQQLDKENQKFYPKEVNEDLYSGLSSDTMSVSLSPLGLISMFYSRDNHW